MATEEEEEEEEEEKKKKKKVRGSPAGPARLPPWVRVLPGPTWRPRAPILCPPPPKNEWRAPRAVRGFRLPNTILLSSGVSENVAGSLQRGFQGS